jgi:hypothetical protein
MKLEFRLHEIEYALVYIPRPHRMPEWAAGNFIAIIQAGESMTVVCNAHAAPATLESKRGFRCLEIVGSFDLTSVGVVAAAARPLAEEGISIFAYSTWQTDYILIQYHDLERAKKALASAGHVVDF